jgi:hypothetical protein
MEEPVSGKTILLKVIHQRGNGLEMYKSPKTLPSGIFHPVSK